jgi:hypothetical protein
VAGLYGFEHYVERTQLEGARSGPDDLDLVVLLFVPEELVQVKTELGNELRELRPALLSRRAGRGYGYLRQNDRKEER